MILFLIPLFLQPQSANAAPGLQASIQSALLYLESTQTTYEDGYEPGQWRAQVTSTSLPSHVGVGEPGVSYEEPSAFVAASVANVLAEIYFANRRDFPAIPGMIDKAVAGLDVYRSEHDYRGGPDFYFYPPKVYGDLLVRGPRFMHLNPRWYGFTDTPPDADTSSSSFLLLSYQKAMKERVSPQEAGFSLTPETIDEFESARDVNRLPHIYNRLHGDVNTGAFLTWLFDENSPSMPHYYFASPDKGERIPFNWNDVDCVVNTNVIKMLTVSHEEGTPGYANACQYLNRVAARREFYTCGMYYPSDFALPYAMSVALELGAECLEPSRGGLLENVLASQEKDGSWKNHELISRPDPVQSTAWALNTLLLLGNPQDGGQRASAQRAVDFLISQSSLDEAGHVYWTGQVFYGAIFIARYPVVWRSSAYTTALAVRALELAERKWHLRG
jgi:hypothetical protein